MIGEQEPGIAAAVAAEIEEFEVRACAFTAGAESEDTFKPYRLSHGIYGQRQPGYQMVRVKIPHGRLTAAQLEALADFSERFCDEGEYPGGGGRGMGHVTTRQDVQFHFVPLARVPEAMRHLARAGLTTREACFNTVRNVTGCALAGACGTEAFDITTYAQATTELFLRNPICQNLPRKFKIAFSGCATDCGLGAIHDIGAVARVCDGERGFRVWVGGDSATRRARRPCSTTSCLCANSSSSSRPSSGCSTPRARARIATAPGSSSSSTGPTRRRRSAPGSRRSPPGCRRTPGRGGCSRSCPSEFEREREGRDAAAPRQVIALDGVVRGIGYARWRATNVTPHSREGYGLVSLRLGLGDISAAQLRVAAEAARRWSGGEARTSVGQNLVLRDVRLDELGALHDFLLPHGLAEAEALGIRDVVTCPGADTCNLGITSSRGLGRAVSRWLDGARLQDLPEFAGTSIKASGCPNSCSQHHVATVGFYGNSKHVGDDPVPHYMLMLGGGVDARGARMAQPVMKIPARRVPLALERLVGQYREEREGGELFAAWVERADREAVRMCLEDLALSDSPSKAEVVDWDQEVAFTGRTGEGECAV